MPALFWATPISFSAIGRTARTSWNGKSPSPRHCGRIPDGRQHVWSCSKIHELARNFRWLLAKTGAHADLQRVRSLSQEATGAAFEALFGEEPFSTMWADHIAENCPGPGEIVTPRGQDVYRSILHDIQSGRFVVVETWNAALAASAETVAPPPPARLSGPSLSTIGVLGRSAPAQDAVGSESEIRYRVTQMGAPPNLGQRIKVPHVDFKPSRPVVVTVPVGTKNAYDPEGGFGEVYYSLAIDVELEGDSRSRYLKVWGGTSDFGLGDRVGTLTAALEIDLSRCEVEVTSEDEGVTRVRMHANGSTKIQGQAVSIAEGQAVLLLPKHRHLRQPRRALHAVSHRAKSRVRELSWEGTAMERASRGVLAVRLVVRSALGATDMNGCTTCFPVPRSRERKRMSSLTTSLKLTG